MESPLTPPRTRGTKRTHSPSPITPSPNRQDTPPAPGAPRRQIRRRRVNPNLPINLSTTFNEAARQQAEDDDFRANQTGKEQQVPNSPSVSDYEDDDDDEF